VIQSACGVIAALAALCIVVPDTAGDVVEFSSSTRLNVRVILLTVFAVCVVIAVRA